MNKRPKFSIIIPVYNVEDYLSKCLDSAIGQTMLDIEIICVNDGSKDGSFDILRQYAQQDDRIKVVDKSNGGLSSARNAGLKVATGEYICFLDSDDYVEPNLCERLYKEILQWKPDIIVFGANIFPLTKDTDAWTYNNLSPWTQIFPKFKPEIILSGNRGYPFVWRNCFKRKYLESKGLWFNEKVKFGEDTVFQLCAFPGARNIIFILDKLYNYRYDRKNSLMFNSRRDEEWRLHAHLEILDAIARYWKKKGYMEKWNDLFLAFSLDFFGYNLFPAKGVDKKEFAQQYFAFLRKYGVKVKLLKISGQFRRVYERLKFCTLGINIYL